MRVLFENDGESHALFLLRLYGIPKNFICPLGEPKVKLFEKDFSTYIQWATFQNFTINYN